MPLYWEDSKILETSCIQVFIEFTKWLYLGLDFLPLWMISTIFSSCVPLRRSWYFPGCASSFSLALLTFNQTCNKIFHSSISSLALGNTMTLIILFPSASYLQVVVYFSESWVRFLRHGPDTCMINHTHNRSSLETQTPGIIFSLHQPMIL